MAKAPRSIDQDIIRQLADLLTETGLSEIEIEQEGLRVRVARQTTVSAMVPQAAPASAASRLAAPAESETADPADHPGAVTSPMVGTAYHAPEPGAKPFVTVGQEVKAGQTLMIVEAMKTMNPIPAPKAGTVTAVIVTDGAPVEFGEALLIVE